VTNLLSPPVQGGAFDDFLTTVAPASRDQPRWREEDGPLPALYLGHGAPPLFNGPLWISQLFAWAQSFAKPRAVLIVSAHWESAPLALSASAAGTPLVYDFAGFDRRFFTMTYPTPDAGALAAQVTALMSDTETVHEHPRRGLDHGAWVPLKVMYPYADVPVLQLSLPTADPDRLLRIGERLRPLREQGVLIIGSGYLIHGLPFSAGRTSRTTGCRAGRPSSTPGPRRAWPTARATASPTSVGLRACRTPTPRSSTTRRSSSPWARPPTLPR
jgi:4,5-DOPA dioxygenase extradiol